MNEAERQCQLNTWLADRFKGLAYLRDEVKDIPNLKKKSCTQETLNDDHCIFPNKKIKRIFAQFDNQVEPSGQYRTKKPGFWRLFHKLAKQVGYVYLRPTLIPFQELQGNIVLQKSVEKARAHTNFWHNMVMRSIPCSAHDALATLINKKVINKEDNLVSIYCPVGKKCRIIKPGFYICCIGYYRKYQEHPEKRLENELWWFLMFWDGLGSNIDAAPPDLFFEMGVYYKPKHKTDE